jgi:pyruvate dehydrogenase E1 component
MATPWNAGICSIHPNLSKVPYVTACFEDAPGVFVAASNYVKALPDSISQWIPRPLVTLGTGGFGRSDDRVALRDFFEVDARYITLATLCALAPEGQISFTLYKQRCKAWRQTRTNPILWMSNCAFVAF